MKINKLSWYALELKTTCLIFCETNICVNVHIRIIQKKRSYFTIYILVIKSGDKNCIQTWIKLSAIENTTSLFKLINNIPMLLNGWNSTHQKRLNIDLLPNISLNYSYIFYGIDFPQNIPHFNCN